MSNKHLIICAFILLLSPTFTCSAQQNSKATGHGAHSAFKKQAKTLSEHHQWVSFNYIQSHFYDGSPEWEGRVEVILKYDGADSFVFINNDNHNFYLATNRYYKRLDHQKHNILYIKKNKKDKSDTYSQTCIYGFIPNFLRHLSYYLKPIGFLNTWAVFSVVSECDAILLEDKAYKRYISNMMGEKTVSFVNSADNVLDSVYTEWTSDDGHYIKNFYNIYDVRFDNRQPYIDSIFNFDNREYLDYSRYDEFTMPVMSSLSDDLSDALDYPLVNLDNDTVRLREQEGWFLLNFWSLNCNPCLANLLNYRDERDSLGYRLLEKEGIKILAIEHRSNNMELIGDVAERTDSHDIIYSAKGIGTAISIPYLGYYYLVSPSKEIVLETGDCDYDKILNAKREYERSMK